MARALAAVALIVLTSCSARAGGTDFTPASSSGLANATLHLESTTVGEPQTVRVSVPAQRDGDAEATLDWSMAGMPMSGGGHAALVREAGPGIYVQRGFAFSMAGRWNAVLRIRRSHRPVERAVFSVTATE